MVFVLTVGWQWWLYSHNSVSSGGNDMAGEGGGTYITLRSQFTHNCRGGGGSYISVPVMVLTEFHVRGDTYETVMVLVVFT